jgi:hypothetical protein
MGPLIIKLRDLIVASYEDNEFAMLMYESTGDFDYAGLSGSFQLKVFETVKWAYRFGEAPHVLWLAEKVSNKRPKRDDLKALVNEIKAYINPAAVGAPGLANQNQGGLPPELSASLSLFEQRQFTIRDLLQDLRPRLRTSSYLKYDLPGQCHLSDSEGHRLLAVLALEAEPSPIYLRWLSERVSVEEPLVGYVATQGLTAAAIRIPASDVTRVRAASVAAVDRLDSLVESDDEVVPGIDSAARKRQLDLALSIGEIRSRKGKSIMTPQEADAFLAAVLQRFDRASFDGLCRKRLSTELKWLANLEDPWEIIVASVFVTARDKRWERDLISAAFAEQGGEPAFQAVHMKYVAAGV